MKPPNSVSLEESGFVIVKSQEVRRGGPPFLAVIVAVMLLPSTTTTLETVGVGPLPLLNVTEAPGENPLPEIVTETDELLEVELGVISSIETSAETSLTVTVVDEISDTIPSLTTKETVKSPVEVCE